MAKVLLVRPQQIHWRNEAKKSKGHEVYFIDATIEDYEQERGIKPGIFEYGLSQAQLEVRISAIDPDYVGIQCMFTCFWEQSIKVAHSVKKVNPNSKVVLGGHHASGTAYWLLENMPSLIDYIVIGEGEIAFCDLIDNPPKNSKIITGKKLYLENAPNPSLEMLDSKLFNTEMSHFGVPRGQNFITNVVSRGCPTECDFCTSPYYFGNEVRTYSIEQIINQLKILKSIGFTEYVVQDDNILSFTNIFRKQFYHALRNSGLQWNLDGGLYYSLVNEDHIKELAENGCYRVFLPIENPDINIMHNHNKYINLINNSAQKKSLFKVIDWLNNYNIEFYSAAMLGFPGETISSIKKSISFVSHIKEKGAISIEIHWVHPYPYTPFYEKSYLMVPEDRRWEISPEYYSFFKPVFPIKGMSIDELEIFVIENISKINHLKIN
jgi:radical SAM superfamily enzyme YgiQ (UPF0313 family)